MRNLKKFLALVLAMLMVSACAVSVSAFDDQKSVDASVNALGINTLANLNVLVGDGNGDFRPNDTLRRDEAAVVFSKLLAGKEGMKVEWTKGTSCLFDDVEAQWSFTAINFAYTKGVMTGIGDNLFNPEGTLTIEEALTATVKAFPKALAKYLELEKANPANYWATNYVAAAEQCGLTAGLDTIFYDQDCTRAQLAQIAYNLYEDNTAKADGGLKLKDNFGLTSVVGATLSYDDKGVYLNKGAADEVSFSIDAFKAAMAQFGIEGEYADYANAELFECDYIEGKVYSLKISSANKEVELAVVKDADGNNTDVVTVDGEKFAVTAGVGGTTFTIGGTAAMTTIDITVDGVAYAAKADLPDFFKAIAVDSNLDGVWDKVNVTSYTYGFITKAADQLTISSTKKIDNIIIYNDDDDPATPEFDATEAFNNKAATEADSIEVKLTGKEFAFSTKVPVVYYETTDTNTGLHTVDVIEVAQEVSGKLTAYSVANKYVAIDGVKYSFFTGKTAPANMTLNQTTYIYTLAGKFFAVNEDKTYTDINLFVDDVVVKDGKAVITGYDKDTFKVTTITVDGWLNADKNGRLEAIAGIEELKKDASDKVVNGQVWLGVANKDGAKVARDNSKFDGKVGFAEGQLYSFKKTDDGIFYIGTDATPVMLDAYAANESGTDKIKVSGGYVYFDGHALKKFNSASAVIMYKNDLAADNENFYAQTYAQVTSFAEKNNVEYAFLLDTADALNVKMMWIKNTGTGVKTTDKITALASGETIVQIINGDVQETDYTYDSYKAVDVLTGKECTVKTDKTVVVGNFYIVKEGLIIDAGYAATDWVRSDVTVTVSNDLELKKTALTTYVNKIKAADGTISYESKQNTSETTFDLSTTITIYKADSTGLISVKDGAAEVEKVDDVLTQNSAKTFTAYCVGKTLIIINKAA